MNKNKETIRDCKGEPITLDELIQRAKNLINKWSKKGNRNG